MGLWMVWTHKCGGGRGGGALDGLDSQETAVPVLEDAEGQHNDADAEKHHGEGEQPAGKEGGMAVWEGWPGGPHPHLQLRALQEILCPSLT